MPVSSQVVVARPCAVCGKEMEDPETKMAFIGAQVSVEIREPTFGDHIEFYKKQFGVYAPLLLESEGYLVREICWECVLKSMGIKPK